MFWNKRGHDEDDLGNLWRALHDLESDNKRLRAEWADMFERLVRREDRIRKRLERGEAEPLPMTPQDVKTRLRASLAARRAPNGTS
jgi:hypothetical protein